MSRRDVKGVDVATQLKKLGSSWLGVLYYYVIAADNFHIFSF